MKNDKRRKFTREFKLEAVRLWKEGGKTAREVGSDLGINDQLLTRWHRQLSNGKTAGEVFPGNGKLVSADEELRRLRRENAVLRQEREILKKAAAFFARESR